MDLLDDLYYHIAENSNHQDKEYRKLLHTEGTLVEKFHALNPDLMDQLLAVMAERESLACKAFFLHGLRFGLELLTFQAGGQGL